MKPTLLVMDEPTGNLDELLGFKIIDYILKLSTGITVVVATHNVNIANKFDKIYTLHNGVLNAN